MQQKIRVAIYVRVSTTDQSCELQIQEINKFLNAKDWQVVQTYEDQATGTNTNRPQLQQMLSDAAEDKFDVIVIDPPWNQGKTSHRGVRPNQGKNLDYPTLLFNDISKIPIEKWAKEGCFVFLWVTN